MTAFVLLMLTSIFGGDIKSPAAIQTPANGWPTFRGNLQMTGVSAAVLPEKLELLWKVDTKEPFEATAAIANGIVYLPSLDGSCFALKLSDGSQVWKYLNKEKDGVKSSPCIAGGVVAYGDEQGNYRGLDRKTGEQKWLYKSNAEVISSGSFIDGKIYFGSYDESLYCLNAADGKLAWSVKTEGPVHCSPTLVGDEMIVAGCDGNLRFVSIKTGKQTRMLEIGGNIASTPAVIGSRIVFGTMGNQVIGVDIAKLEKLWTYENPKRQMAFYSSAAVSGELAFIGGRDKLLHAIEIESGKSKWTLATKKKIDSSPVICGNRLFIGVTDGTLLAVDLATGEEKWSYPAGGEGFTSSPAIAEGRLVIGDLNGTVYCFGTK